MEITMKTCPKCHKEYNPKFFPSCPNCPGQPSSNNSISATTPINAAFGEQPGVFENNSDFRTVGLNGEPSPNASFGVTAPVSPISNDNGYYHPEGFDTMTEVIGKNTGSKKQPPVVGWLVITTGELAGTDYRIHSNYNYIGRDKGDIVIDGDMKISRENDSAIVYDIPSKRFYIEHKNGTNTIGVNDEPVIGGSKELQAYDNIRIGETNLLFIPLCGEKFAW